MLPKSAPLTPATLLDLMAHQRYGVEFQPIVDTRSQDTFAYEALSRFHHPGGRPLRPDLVYAALHDNPLCLFQVEHRQKQLQLEAAPADYPLFVNLDQDAYHAYGENGEDNPFIQLLRLHPGRTVVVELIENTEVNDAVVSMAMIEAFAQLGVPTAIDDVGAPHTMLSLSIIQVVDYLKFDKYLVRNRRNERNVILARAIMDYARAAGKRVIVEGVETPADLDFARQFGADYVQGFLYRERFIGVECAPGG